MRGGTESCPRQLFFCCHIIDLIGYNLESNLSKDLKIPELITVIKNK